jgi:hypothetical protein
MTIKVKVLPNDEDWVFTFITRSPGVKGMSVF